MWKYILLTLLAVSVCLMSPAGADGIIIIDPPPGTNVRLDQSLAIKYHHVDVQIKDQVATTRVDQVFINDHPWTAEGTYIFPLPEGAAVSGYALDIKGVMVDGVVVEKQKGREVYEKIVRQGIDPGLVEWVKGSNFKTRVFPIPAKGTRTIRVDYVAELVDKAGSAAYHLPLAFKEKLDELALRIEVVKGAAEPKATGGPAGLQFSKFQDTYLAESKGKDVALDSDLVVALPRGISRHIVRFVRINGIVYAVKEV